MIVLFASSKGGTGKSTLATNICVWLATHKREVMLVDSDRQGSASAWAAQRYLKEDRAKITCTKLEGDVSVPLKDIGRKYEEVVVDVGGFDSPMMRSAMLVSQLVMIPVQASQFDLWTLSSFRDAVAQARRFNSKLGAACVVNKAPTNVKNNELAEAEQFFSEFNDFGAHPHIIHDRKVYREAAWQGFGVLEMENETARIEINGLAESIYGKI